MLNFLACNDADEGTSVKYYSNTRLKLLLLVSLGARAHVVDTFLHTFVSYQNLFILYLLCN